MKKEAKFNTFFNHWLKEVYKKTGAYELKQVEHMMPFDAVVPHQILALQNVRHNTFVWKIPDAGYQNPFDTFCLNEMPAYVVIKFKSFFVLIDVDTFVLEKKRSARKSLLASRAQEIATVTVRL